MQRKLYKCPIGTLLAWESIGADLDASEHADAKTDNTLLPEGLRMTKRNWAEQQPELQDLLNTEALAAGKRRPLTEHRRLR